jgi:hypothetical protein
MICHRSQINPGASPDLDVEPRRSEHEHLKEVYGGPDTQYWAVAPNLPGNVNKSGPITEIIDGRSTTYRAQE